MTDRCVPLAAAGLLVTVMAACGPATQAPATPPGRPAAGADVLNAATRYPYVQADVDFMSGMIPHHAQAVLIAGWAESHGAREDVKILAARIVVGQKDEIELMRTWLRDRDLPVPAADAKHHKHVMNGMEHEMLMPGMLTDEELAQLDKARGPEFDKLFLTHMIRHHEGAIAMVETLFKSYGAAQDETVFRFASDVEADQNIEIDRMLKMLQGRSAPESHP